MARRLTDMLYRRAPALDAAAGSGLMRGVIAGLLSTAAAVAAPIAHAQDGASESGDIVVTALKRSQSIQDVPITLNAFSSDQLAARQISGAEDLIGSVPNLAVNSPMGAGSPVYSLRGVTMSDYSLTQSAPVATYYDEVYKGSFPILGLNFYDLERVEVLKGPQGTLYGKNTTGGAVNIVSRRPEFESESYLMAGIGNYDRRSLEGAVQTPLGPTLAARVAFTIERANGWAKNAYPGAPDSESVRQYGIRAGLRFKPSDGVDITLRGSTSLQNPYTYAVIAIPAPAFGGIGGADYPRFGITPVGREGLGKRELNTPDVGRRRVQSHALALTALIDLSDNLSLTSITSWDRGKMSTPEDAEGLPYKASSSLYTARETQITQDLRISSTFSGPFQFIVGGYFSDETIDATGLTRQTEDIDYNRDGTIGRQDCLDALANGEITRFTCQQYNQFTQKKRGFALYSDLTYEVSAQLTLRGGLRFTNDRGRITDFFAQYRDVTGVPISNNIPGDPSNLFATTGIRFSNNNLSGKIGFDYRVDSDIMLYASYSRGFRGAAFNSQAYTSPSQLASSDPETVDAVEAGFKTELFDRRLTFNGAAFWYGYKNSQFLDAADDGSGSTLANLDRARYYGAEFDLTARITDNLTFSGGIGLVHAEVTKGSLYGVDLKGNRMINAPKFTGNAAIDWSIPIGDWGFADAHADVATSSNQYFDIFNSPYAAEDGFTVVNARLRIHPAEDRFGAAIWVKNLNNEYYYVNRFDFAATSGYYYTHVNEPRTYGITLDAKF